MKTLVHTRNFVIAILFASSVASHAQDQTDNPMPVNIQPGTPLADVVKLLQAGVDTNTIAAYIQNTSGAFNLDADEIIFLKDEGLPSDIINSMMAHDKNAVSTDATPPPTTQTTTTVDDTAPPTTTVDTTYFTTTLTPYGSWIEVDGYGRCWRPTAVIYDSGWRPYCDRGHWVYTDCGWYWESDYSWGVTFHYGRWFRDSHFGWCWFPDTEWAPSWVTWRSSDDYCGWAPLPPHAEFRPGVGFFYRGAAVSVDFDFGLSADCFTFVPPSHFCDRRPRNFAVAPARVPQIFHETKIINNYNVHDRFVANNGIPVARISQQSHRDIQPVQIASLPHAAREASPIHSTPDMRTRNSSGNNPSHNANLNSHPPIGSPTVSHENLNNRAATPEHSTPAVTPAHEIQNQNERQNPRPQTEQHQSGAPFQNQIPTQPELRQNQNPVLPSHSVSPTEDNNRNQRSQESPTVDRPISAPVQMQNEHSQQRIQQIQTQNRFENASRPAPSPAPAESHPQNQNSQNQNNSNSGGRGDGGNSRDKNH